MQNTVSWAGFIAEFYVKCMDKLMIRSGIEWKTIFVKSKLNSSDVTIHLTFPMPRPQTPSHSKSTANLLTHRPRYLKNIASILRNRLSASIFSMWPPVFFPIWHTKKLFSNTIVTVWNSHLKQSAIWETNAIWLQRKIYKVVREFS